MGAGLGGGATGVAQYPTTFSPGMGTMSVSATCRTTWNLAKIFRKFTPRSRSSPRLLSTLGENAIRAVSRL